MAKYIKLPAVQTGFVLLKSGSYTENSKNYSNETGNISSILIANEHASTALVVSLFLKDIDATSPTYDESFFIIRYVEIAEGSTLVLQDNLSFDINRFELQITTTGTGVTATIIIK
jgi:hypothetical protein